MIKDIGAGQIGNTVLLCSDISYGVAKNGSEFASMTLQDKSGTIACKLWGSSKFPRVTAGDLLKVKYSSSVYNGQLQLTISEFTKVDDESLDISDYLKSSKYDTTEMYKQVLAMLKDVQNEWLQQLIDKVLYDEIISASFCKRPGARFVHHAYVGGLLQHTLFTMRNAKVLARVYKPDVNEDLVVTAAFLHDIGKLLEIGGDIAYDMTDWGILAGHISLGAMTISGWCNEIDGFPEDLKKNVIHCILSHHGELEFGSPVKPATIEAIILNAADNLDAKVNIFLEAVDGINANAYNKYLGTTPVVTAIGGEGT